ncbi:MAG: acyltransferase [Bacteroidales bacterium]|nr:acyltransferase [Bacteroidales bacterium]
MKRLVLRLFEIITWPFAKCGWPAFCQRCSILWRNLYSAYIRHQCRQCGELKLGSTQLHLFGLRYMEFGDQVEMHFNARVQCIDYFQPTDQHFKPRLILHDHVVVQAMCHIGCIDRVEIGEWSTMGARCYITDHTHGGTSREELLLPPRKRPLVSRGPVKIGKYVHLGEGVCVMPGVTIGDYSVIGAGAVVTRDIPPFSIAVGSPAKVIKQITQ